MVIRKFEGLSVQLQPTDMLDVKGPDGSLSKQLVMDVLHVQQKHPGPQIPSKLTLLDFTNLTNFEDVETTDNHILWVACTIQGGGWPRWL